jgi:hypothetical protein
VVQEAIIRVTCNEKRFLGAIFSARAVFFFFAHCVISKQENAFLAICDEQSLQSVCRQCAALQFFGHIVRECNIICTHFVIGAEPKEKGYEASEASRFKTCFAIALLNNVFRHIAKRM